MKCPHCLENFFEKWEHVSFGGSGATIEDADYQWRISYTTCPSCKRVVMKLIDIRRDVKPLESLIRPKAPARAPLPTEVPEPVAADYQEACLVLADSPKASAALSRRCLQNLLREHFGVKPGKLASEIEEAMPKLPPYLADAVDAVRNIGNFAAHPEKSENTGAIVDVEPGEAEWSLDVLESLFEFGFVEPEVLRKKREALNQKLAEARKPPMKESAP